MSKPYYLLSARSSDPVIGAVEAKVKEASLGDTFSLSFPKLLVGTLDNLMALSDDLSRVDTFVESITKRIAQQHEDLIEKKPDFSVKGGIVFPSLLIYGHFFCFPATPEDYLTHFSWEHERYSSSLHLKLMLARIQAVLAYFPSLYLMLSPIARH
jgi:V-type H+-transporting ATPase subunit C